MPNDGPSRPARPRRSVMEVFSWLAGDRPDERAQTDMEANAEAFGDLRVHDVMTPRAHVIGIEERATLGDMMRRFLESEHSRLPVYRDSLDEPLGVIHIRDVVRLLAPLDDGDPAPDWRAQVVENLRRDVLFVPSSMRASDLLLNMQQSRSHLALVIDEYGGTDGLVTLEDLLEAVVGDIEDEHDEEVDGALLRRPGGIIDVAASLAVEDLESELERSLELGGGDEIDTIGGLVASLAGSVPQKGQRIRHPAGLEFEVLDADPRLIKRLRVHPITPPPEASGK